MTTACQSCESPVTEQFARVFGDQDNVVHACIACSTGRDLYHGAGAHATGPIEPAGIAILYGP